jgi:hypothetical protein
LHLGKKLNKSWESKYKSHILKAVKKSKERRHEIENLNDDELGDRLAQWMR